MNISEQDLGKVESNIEIDIQAIRFCWKDNPSVQKLLDVVVSIMGEEYIQIAKQNPEIFSKNKSSDS